MVAAQQRRKREDTAEKMAQQEFSKEAIEDRLDTLAPVTTKRVCPICVVPMVAYNTEGIVSRYYCKNGRDDCPYRHKNGYPIVRLTFRQHLLRQGDSSPDVVARDYLRTEDDT